MTTLFTDNVILTLHMPHSTSLYPLFPALPVDCSLKLFTYHRILLISQNTELFHHKWLIVVVVYMCFKNQTSFLLSLAIFLLRSIIEGKKKARDS